MIPSRQEGPVGQAEIHRAVVPDAFLCLRLRYVERRTRVESSRDLPATIRSDGEIAVAKVGLTFERPTLGDSDYPADGYRILGSPGTGRVLDPIIEWDFEETCGSLASFALLSGGVLAAEINPVRLLLVTVPSALRARRDRQHARLLLDRVSR